MSNKYFSTLDESLFCAHNRSMETQTFSPEVNAEVASVTKKHSTFGYAPCRPKMYEAAGAAVAVWLDRRRSSIHEYDVVLCSGEWPSDEDLITICDGHFPEVSHFGGKVMKCDTLRRFVAVYVD